MRPDSGLSFVWRMALIIPDNLEPTSSDTIGEEVARLSGAGTLRKTVTYRLNAAG